MVVFWYSVYLTKRREASEVPTTLSWGLPFEAEVESTLGYLSQRLSVSRVSCGVMSTGCGVRKPSEPQGAKPSRLCRELLVVVVLV